MIKISIGCALVGNAFLAIALFYWFATGNTPFSFGIIGVGLVLQYYYKEWSRWVWGLLR